MSVDRDTLLVDIGNTRLKWCALADADGSARGVRAIVHAEDSAAAEWEACLEARPWRAVWIASVAAPQLLERFERLCRRSAPNVPCQQACTRAVCGDLRVGYTEPAQLGVDRFLAMLAARELWPRARVLLASIGSAITIDLLEADGSHAGGLIAPSPQAMHRSLAGLAPQLASAGPSPHGFPRSAFARDTAGGIASGCALATVGLIEHCARIASASGNAPQLVLTGGGATALAPHLDGGATSIPHLVLAGLRRYAGLACPDPRTTNA